MLMWMLVACAPTPTSWITPDGSVSAAVIEEDGQVLAYVCGNDETTRNVWSRWFDGAWDGERFTADESGWELSGTLDGDTLDLALTGPGGEAMDWLAEPEDAGIYAQEETCLDGAIAMEGRVEGTWCAPDGTRFQVEPVETIVLGDSLELALPDGARRTFLRQRP
jgi:hypothetical protein